MRGRPRSLLHAQEFRWSCPLLASLGDPDAPGGGNRPHPSCLVRKMEKIRASPEQNTAKRMHGLY